MKKTAILALALCAAGCHNAPSDTKTTPAKDAAPVAAAKPAAQEFPLTGNAQSQEALKKGLAFLENSNVPAAKDFFAEAVKADPNCVSAAALAAFALPGAEGHKALAAVSPKIAALPEAERLWLQTYEALRAGDQAKTMETAQKLVAAAPNSPRAHTMLGFVLNAANKVPESVAELQKAIDLDPTYAPPHNYLGYADQKLGKTDDAISQLKTYAELLPTQANPQDSLGEVLLLAGRFEEADVAFQKAISLDLKFAIAWQGSGYARIYKGDVAAGLEAFNKAIAGAADAEEKIAFQRDLAVVQLAVAKPADALKTIASVEKEPALKSTNNAATLPVLTAMVQLETGKTADAVKTLAPVGAAIDKSEAPAAMKTAQNFHRLMVLATAQARLGKKDDAAKTVAAMEVLAKAQPNNPAFTDGIAYANGEAAVAKKDFKAAATAFAGCEEANDWCHYELLTAQVKAGDKAGAEATRTKLGKTYRREAWSLYVHLKTGAAVSGKS